MDICAILLAIAIQTTVCNNMPNPIHKWVSPTIDDKCKNIKCRSVEDPRCVKIIHQQDAKKTMYIIVLNKCEINYIKCHKDFAAKIVPMKQCGHEEIHSTIKFNKTGHVRVKRGVKPNQSASKMARSRNKLQSTLWHNTSFKIKPNNQKSQQNFKKMSEDEGHWHELNTGDSRRYGGRDSDYSEYEDEGGHKIFISRNIKTKGGNKEHWPRMRESDSTSGLVGYLVRQEDIYYDEQRSIIPMSGTPDNLSGFVAGYKVYPDNIYDENEIWLLNTNKSSTDVELPDSLENNDVPGIERETEFPLISKESINSRNKPSEHQDNQNQGSCPGSCPAHSVMVCGKCQHGVYKTFVSVCHMKKFACTHPEEAVNLISRYPCIMSAPFLSEESMSIRGHVDEPNDNDKILNFLKCRDLGRLNGNDRRCKF